MTRLMLTRLSAITPRPTQRLIPVSPLYRLRPSPCRRLTTLMRPSQPVRHLAVAEPTLLLFAFALRALGGAVGDADALDALGFRGRLVLGRVEAGIRRHQVRRAAQRCLMRFDRAKQQVRVAGPPIVDFVGDDDLVLRLLQFDDFAEFGGLAGLAFPNNFSGRLEQADYLVLGVGVAGETRALVW